MARSPRRRVSQRDPRRSKRPPMIAVSVGADHSFEMKEREQRSTDLACPDWRCHRLLTPRLPPHSAAPIAVRHDCTISASDDVSTTR
jgi:hypothetical protein